MFLLHYFFYKNIKLYDKRLIFVNKLQILTLKYVDWRQLLKANVRKR